MKPYNLPLFPLHTVLFPGIPLRLHIFEERYKQMINMCIEAHQHFGVTLIRQGMEAYDPHVEPHSIGCTAHIVEVERLGQGRMNILAIGMERFRLLAINPYDQPFLTGKVVAYPLTNLSTPELAMQDLRLRKWLARYIELMRAAGITQAELDPLPVEPVSLAYLAAAVIQVEPIKKQEFLAQADLASLVSSLNEAYRQEVGLVQKLIAKDTPMQGYFSVN